MSQPMHDSRLLFVLTCVVSVSLLCRVQLSSGALWGSQDEQHAHNKEQKQKKEASSHSQFVTTLTNANFEELLRDAMWIVKFYAPWCSHCVRFAPTYDRIADDMGSELEWVHFGEVDCETDFVVCKSFEIDAYPTLLLCVT